MCNWLNKVFRLDYFETNVVTEERYGNLSFLYSIITESSGQTLLVYTTNRSTENWLFILVFK